MSAVICAICYEELNACTELLQSITQCGHVFHELCLQQWIEYCPHGRKPACPLCKQQYSTKDAHRLFFQSAAGFSPKRGDQCQGLQKPADQATTEELRAQVQKLESRVRVATNAADNLNEKLKELEKKEARQMAQLQRLEADCGEAVKEKLRSHERLAKSQEELKRAKEDCSRLSERNALMAKDIAAHKLVSDVDLGEDDILRLASVGQGRNKDEILDTMIRSLLLRNRAYKELMVRCNELGMGESRALQKAEKLAEQLKRLKARVQELARSQEDKENLELRTLAKLKMQSRREAAENSRLPPSPCKNLQGNYLVAVDRIRVQATERQAPMKTPQLSSINNILGTDTQYSDPGQRSNCSEIIHPAHQKTIRASSIQASRTGEALRIGVNAGEHSVSAKPRKGVAVATSTFYQDTQAEDSCHPSPLSLDRAIKNGSSLDEGCSQLWADEKVDILGNTGECGNTAAQRRLDFVTDVNNCSNLAQESLLSLPIRKESGLVQGGTCGPPLSLLCVKRCSGPLDANVAASKFIVSGADGRGGRITVLKPPQLPVVFGSSKRAKRPKPAVAVNRAGALQIEHFFGRST